ncbi:MAG TPA: sensor histidine kinase [Blastococcus sp.]|nr:sensor histidine kinase [Blastococcus sp.]
MGRLRAGSVAVWAALRRRPVVADAALAAGLAALVVQEITTSDVRGPMGALIPLGVLATLPLTLRRRHRLVALVAVVAGLLGLHQLSIEQEPQTTLLPFLVAVYSVAAHAQPRVAWTGLVVALTAIVVDEPGDTIVLGPLTAATWAVGRLVRSWRRQADDLARLARELEQERADNARLAVASERARIARELHDVVGHTLSLMVLQAGGERLALGSERPATRDALAAIERAGRTTLGELRRLVGVLRADDDEPELAPLPGLAGVPDLVDQVRTTGLPVELRVLGPAGPLPLGLDVSAYRIVQEALTNAVRHASANSVTVCIRYGEGEVCIEVVDDGRPGTPDEPGSGAGHGLVGMRERVALYGGRLTVGPRAGGGWSVAARLPVDGVG